LRNPTPLSITHESTGASCLGVGRILYFDEKRTPREEPLQSRMTWSGFVLAAFRPSRDPLQAGFRAVFAHLSLPWTPQRSLTTAVLLALFGGIFGLHHFYTGHSRRGLWYLAFFWLMVPMVLGWIDAARLALLDDAQFRNRLKNDWRTWRSSTGLPLSDG